MFSKIESKETYVYLLVFHSLWMSSLGKVCFAGWREVQSVPTQALHMLSKEGYENTGSRACCHWPRLFWGYYLERNKSQLSQINSLFLSSWLQVILSLDTLKRQWNLSSTCSASLGQGGQGGAALSLSHVSPKIVYPSVPRL